MKPEIWAKIGHLPEVVQVLFVGLISQADDEGRQEADLALVRARVFPRKDYSTRKVDTWLKALERDGKAARYQVYGAWYVWLPGWAEHQYIKRPRASRLPPPPPELVATFTDGSVNGQGVLAGVQ